MSNGIVYICWSLTVQAWWLYVYTEQQYHELYNWVSTYARLLMPVSISEELVLYTSAAEYTYFG